jgi:putative addiction module component (TIGR02574 family)
VIFETPAARGFLHRGARLIVIQLYPSATAIRPRPLYPGFDKAQNRASLRSMSRHFDTSNLSPSECILLAEQLWEQARAHPETIPLTTAQLDELYRRLDAYERGEMPAGEPWEVVRDRLFSR